MAATHLLALDEGTTSARALVFTLEGKQVGLGRRPIEQHYPQAGWVEHDAGEIWQAQWESVQEALQTAGITPAQVAAIGITNQRETLVLWNRKTGKPLHKAIVWQDRRTAPHCEELKAAGLEQTFQQKTGLVIDPYFSGTKLAWLLDNIPDARARAQRGELAAGTIDSWLIWNLTGGQAHVTDASNASRTLAFNIHTSAWDADLARHLRVPISLWPRVAPSAGVAATTTLLGGSLPIAGIAGDQQAALFGQGCFRPGMAKNTYGTGCFLLMNTGQRAVPSQHRLLTTVAWQLGNETTYALEGAIFSAGASLQWLEQIGVFSGTEEQNLLDAQADESAESSDVRFVPAFAGLGAPQWDPQARGTLLGLTRDTGKAQLVRAALDAMAYQSDEVLQIMQQDAHTQLAELRVDGGVSASDRLMQFQAHLSGVRVVRPAERESTALGAALLAGLGVGLYQNLEQIAALIHHERQFTPEADYPRLPLRLRWQQAVERSLNWAK